MIILILKYENHYIIILLINNDYLCHNKKNIINQYQYLYQR